MRTLQLIYWVVLSLIAELMYNLGLDWCWYTNYAICGLASATFFNRENPCDVYRIGPFMHTSSGWYYNYKRINKNIVAPHW